MTGPEIARMLFNHDGYVVMGTNETWTQIWETSGSQQRIECVLGVLELVE